MKKHGLAGEVAIVTLLVAVWGSQPSPAQMPGILNFQGRVTVAGTNFTGTGNFLFELVNGTGSTGYWGNDGVMPPTNSVQLPVSNGMFSVILGDATLAHMVSIPSSVFTNTDVRLRVWFNGQQLNPDQRIGAAGYALMAANVYGGYVDLTSSQTVSGVKVLTTNLLMQQGTSSTAPWKMGVTDFTGGDLSVHSNVLSFSQNGAVQLLMVPDANVAFFPGEIDSGGDIKAGGEIRADGNISGSSLNVDGAIQANGDVSGNNLNANGDIHANSNLLAEYEIQYANHSGSGGQLSTNGAILLGGLHVKGAIDADGNIHANGGISCNGVKSFVEPHPTDPTKEIVYTCLEGPEAGTYVRGSAEMVNGQAVIALPGHFGMVTSPNGLTVQLTPRGTWLELFVTTATVAQVTVGEAQGRSGHFDYLVQGVRLGYENKPVIQERTVTGASK